MTTVGGKSVNQTTKPSRNNLEQAVGDELHVVTARLKLACIHATGTIQGYGIHIYIIYIYISVYIYIYKITEPGK